LLRPDERQPGKLADFHIASLLLSLLRSSRRASRSATASDQWTATKTPASRRILAIS
jgi:hypothetical protein